MRVSGRWPVVLGTPPALALLTFFHPSPCDEVAGELVPMAGWWALLHTVQFVLFAFMGVAVWALVAGLRGIFADLARAGAVVFALFYGMGDAGIATGLLAGAAGDGRLEGQVAVRSIEALFADPTKNPLFQVGIYGWVVAAVALYLAGAPAAFFLTFDHAFPFGSLAFACFFAGAVWIEISSGGTERSAGERPRRVR